MKKDRKKEESTLPNAVNSSGKMNTYPLDGLKAYCISLTQPLNHKAPIT